MSKGRWNRDPDTGIPAGRLIYVESKSLECFEALHELDDGRRFFLVNSAAWMTSGGPHGAKVNVSRTKARMLGSTAYAGEPVFTVVDADAKTSETDPEPKLIGFLDCPASAQAWGEMDRRQRRAKQLAGKPLVTDFSD